MKNELTYNTVKQTLSRLFLLGTLAVLVGSLNQGCDAVILPDPADLPETPEEIPRGNPVDPQNNQGNQYSLQLNIEVLTPRDGNTLQGDLLEVSFNPEVEIPSGFTAQLKYSVEYARDANYIPETEYFDVEPNTTYSIGPLDEGDYTLRYSYRLVGLSEAVGDPIQFSVDANTGPGFVFYRKANQTVTNGNPISFELWMDDIEDIAGFSLNVTSSLSLLNGSVTFQPYTNERTDAVFSGPAGSTFLYEMSSQSESDFTINMALLYSGTPNVTKRTGPIGLLTITPQAGSSGNAILSVNEDQTSVRTSKNEVVSLGQNGTKTIIVN